MVTCHFHATMFRNKLRVIRFIKPTDKDHALLRHQTKGTDPVPCFQQKIPKQSQVLGLPVMCTV